jgi:hypothetical protein
VERGEDAAVYLEAGQRFEYGLAGRVERGVDLGYLVHPLRVDQYRAGPVPGPQRAVQHQLTLGDEQPVRRLPAGTQLQVGQRTVVTDPVVVRVGDGYRVGQGQACSGRGWL